MLSKLLENVLSIAHSNYKYILYSAAFFDVFSTNLSLGRLEVAFSSKLADLYKQDVATWDKLAVELKDILKNKTDFILHVKKRIATKYYSLGRQNETDAINQSMIYLEKAHELSPEDALTKEALFDVYLEIISPTNPGYRQTLINRLSWSPGKEHLPLCDKAIKLMPGKFGPHIQKFIDLYQLNSQNEKACKLYRKWKKKEKLTINEATRAFVLEKKKKLKAKKTDPK